MSVRCTAETKMIAVVLEPGMVADHRRKLESVGFGHVNVDENEGDILLEKVLERFPRELALIRFAPS